MDQSGPARKQSLPLPMPRGRRLASASRGPDQGRGSIMKIDGGCHCGYITYEAEADPERPPSAIARTASVSPDRRFAPSSASPATHSKSSLATHHLCKDRRKRRKTGARIAPDVERQSTRLPKETSRNCTPSVWGLYANVLRLSRRCRFGLARNCTGSPTWAPFVAWTGSELRRLIRMHGISSAACRFLRSRILNALPLGNRA